MPESDDDRTQSANPREGRDRAPGRSDQRGEPRGGRPSGSGSRSDAPQRGGSDRRAGGGGRPSSGDRGGPAGRAGGGDRTGGAGRPEARGARGGSGAPRGGGGPSAGRGGTGRSEDRRAGAGRSDERRGTDPRRGSADRNERSGPGSRRSDSRSDGRGGSTGRDTGRRGAPASRDAGARTRSAPVEHFPEPARLEIPSWARTADLDPSVRSALRSLSARAAEEVSGHLAAAAEYLDDDPTAALAHARVARSHAARVAVVREAVGIAAYRAGEWNEALSELRAAHRMSGELYLVPLLMDTERALGRPQAALKLAETLRGKRLDAATRVELAVVTAGVRRDMGSTDAALAVLEREDLQRQRDPELAVRLWYAYADALEHAGRRDEAARWFGEAAGRDREGVTDAADRAAGLL